MTNATTELVDGDSLWRRYAKPLAYFVAPLVRGIAEPEDVVQDIMVKVAQHISRIDRGRRPGPWIYAIARNHCIDVRRRGVVRFESDGDAGATEVDSLPDLKRAAPEQAVLTAETREAVRRALSHLSADDRQILFLRYFEDLSCREIAEIVGRPEGTVKYRIHEAKAVLRRKLAAHVVAEGCAPGEYGHEC